ncbi:unnamed protein product [Penicillium glandicola]
MGGDPRFVILKYQAWMKASEFEHAILGAIVKEPLSPSTNYEPDPPLAGYSHRYQTGDAMNFVLANERSAANEFETSLGSVAGFSVSGNQEDSIHLAGKFIRFKRIQQLDRYWDKLKVNPEVETTVPTWVSRYYGIMICEDVDISTEGQATRTLEGNVQFPLGQVTLPAGVPDLIGDQLDPQIQTSSTATTATIFRAKSGTSSIFAVELKRITTPRFSSRLRLERDGPDIDDTRLAGDEPDDEEDLEEAVLANDMILENPFPEDYDDMVN